MRLLIDINHPAHVHYFRNFIKIMEKKGHDILVISRNKEIEHYLLNSFNIPFIDRGKGKNSLLGKTIYFFKAIYFIYKQARVFKPNIIISFGTPYPAIAGWLLKIPHISFNDTEHAKLHHLLTDRFSKTILTPSCYNKDLGKKQIRFNGFMELCYLHHNYYNSDPSILDSLGVKDDEKYIIIRFVSWNAAHDVGQTGLTIGMKLKIVNELSKYAKVFISSEGELPVDLKKYRISIPPEKMHDALSYATFFIGESPTMSTESVLLKTPAICISSWACDCGNFQSLKKYNLMECYHPEEENSALEKALNILKNKTMKKEWNLNWEKLLYDKIDVTAFMIWFIENYPESTNIMKDNPDYQNRFK